jgi:hypothetical protein
MAAVASDIVCDRRKLLDQIDAHTSALCESWDGDIVFPCIPIANPSLAGCIFQSSLECVNICDHLNSSAGQVERLYLDPIKYTSPLRESTTVDIKSNTSWLLLKEDFQRTAHECGSPVVANGGGSKVRYFVCKFKARIYQVNKSFINTSQAHGPFRSDSLINL